MVEQFEADTPGQLEELGTALPVAAEGGPDAAAAVTTARAVLHKLKGGAVTLGATALGNACEELRQRLIACDAPATLAPAGPGTLAALRASYQAVLGASCRRVASRGWASWCSFFRSLGADAELQACCTRTCSCRRSWRVWQSRRSHEEQGTKHMGWALHQRCWW